MKDGFDDVGRVVRTIAIETVIPCRPPQAIVVGIERVVYPYYDVCLTRGLVAAGELVCEGGVIPSIWERRVRKIGENVCWPGRAEGRAIVAAGKWIEGGLDDDRHVAVENGFPHRSSELEGFEALRAERRRGVTADWERWTRIIESLAGRVAIDNDDRCYTPRKMRKRCEREKYHSTPHNHFVTGPRGCAVPIEQSIDKSPLEST